MAATSRNLVFRTGRSRGPSDLRFTIYDLRGSDGVITALVIRAPGDLRCAALVNRTS